MKIKSIEMLQKLLNLSNIPIIEIRQEQKIFKAMMFDYNSTMIKYLETNIVGMLFPFWKNLHQSLDDYVTISCIHNETKPVNLVSKWLKSNTQKNRKACQTRHDAIDMKQEIDFVNSMCFRFFL